MERCSIMGLGIRHDGNHWWQSLVAIDGGLIWWIDLVDWLAGWMFQTSPLDLVRQIPPSELVVWSLCNATLMFKQASQPGENS